MSGDRQSAAVAARAANPEWPREVWQTLAHEWRAYAAAVVAATATPRRFAAAWADGARSALNPALCALNAAALLGGWTLICRHAIFHRADVELPLWAEALKPLMVFAQVLCAVLPGHALLRLLGARRPLRTTVGVALYVFSGPLMLLGLVGAAVTPLLEARAVAGSSWSVAFWSEQALLVGVIVAYVTAALAGACRLRPARAGAAVLVMFVVAELARHALFRLAPTLFHLLV